MGPTDYIAGFALARSIIWFNFTCDLQQMPRHFSTLARILHLLYTLQMPGGCHLSMSTSIFTRKLALQLRTITMYLDACCAVTNILCQKICFTSEDRNNKLELLWETIHSGSTGQKRATKNSSFLYATTSLWTRTITSPYFITH